jgi:hypothetical protein
MPTTMKRDQRHDPVITLATLHLSRLRRPLVAVLVSVPVMIALSVLRHGWSVDATLPWLLGVSLILPFAPGITLVKEKADGSLRYYASLPVSGESHAFARALVSLLLALLPGLVVGLATRSLMPAENGALPWAAGIGAATCLFALSLALLAFQMKASIGEAATYMVYAMLGIGLGVGVIGKVASLAVERGWLASLLPILHTRTGLAAASGVLWLVCATAGVVAFRSIARTSVRYRGEIARV